MRYWLKSTLTCAGLKYSGGCSDHTIVLLVISTKSNTIRHKAKQNFTAMIKSLEAAVQNLPFNLKSMGARWKASLRVESGGAFHLTWWICFSLSSYFNKFNS